MRLLLVLAALAISADAVADPRWPDGATRRAAAGCWDVGQGATLTLAPYGKHNLGAVARFTSLPRGGPAVMRGLAGWRRERGAFEVPCRPRSQHGSFCLVQPEAGRLRVRVYARRHRSGATGHLAEDFLADRCRKSSVAPAK